jgi:hypothetical protein
MDTKFQRKIPICLQSYVEVTLTVVLFESQRVVSVILGRVDDQLACVKANQEGTRRDNQAQSETSLLEGPREGEHSGADHCLPHAENDNDAGVFLRVLGCLGLLLVQVYLELRVGIDYFSLCSETGSGIGTVRS